MKTLLGPGFYNVSFEGNEKSAPSYSFANEVGKKAIEDNNSDYAREKQIQNMDRATGHRAGKDDELKKRKAMLKKDPKA